MLDESDKKGLDKFQLIIAVISVFLILSTGFIFQQLNSHDELAPLDHHEERGEGI